MTLEVIPADSKRDRERFMRLPWRLYKDFPGWVPNLLLLQRDVFSTKKNPFFDHGEAQLFLALRDGEPVGRISAQIDHRHNTQHNEKTGFFGFFESVNDPVVASVLLVAAEDWLRVKGMDTIRGPFNFSLDEELDLQIEGFGEPAMIQMPQTHRYYPSLVEAFGYTKAQEQIYQSESGKPSGLTDPFNPAQPKGQGAGGGQAFGGGSSEQTADIIAALAEYSRTARVRLRGRLVIVEGTIPHGTPEQGIFEKFWAAVGSKFQVNQFGGGGFGGMGGMPGGMGPGPGMGGGMPGGMPAPGGVPIGPGR